MDFCAAGYGWVWISMIFYMYPLVIMVINGD